MAKFLAISKAGAKFDPRNYDRHIINRLNKTPTGAVDYQYILVSDDIEGSYAELITIKDFRKVKQLLKRKIRRGTGLEIMIAPCRKLDSQHIARWFEDVRDLYLFCKSSGCQLILSSGANSVQEMVSGPCLDAILKYCGIQPEKHWQSMNEWLDRVLSNRVMFNAKETS